MSTRNYTIPVEQTRWQIESGSNVVFNWEYDEGRERLLTLYEKGKNLQWQAGQRLDWSHSLDPKNPLGVPDEYVPICGSPAWERLDEKGRSEVRLHMAAWQYSQFLHGEQGALICTARIVESVPDLDAKFYAATQVMDEARHVEVFSRVLREKLGIAYPINGALRTLLDQVISDRRWDMTYLGMQVIIEGLALASFALQRDLCADPFIRALTAYVMQDEARHVAFGRLALRDYYPRLSEAERREREEFVVEASLLMRDRFLGEEIWENLELGTNECVAYVESSGLMREYRRVLFSRIVPIVKDIGLWGPRVERAYTSMGVIEFAAMDPDELSAADETIALEYDAARRSETKKVIELGAPR